MMSLKVQECLIFINSIEVFKEVMSPVFGEAMSSMFEEVQKSTKRSDIFEAVQWLGSGLRGFSVISKRLSK